MSVAPKVELTNEQRSTLQAWANGRKTPVRLAERSRIVLFAAEGKRDIDIASALSITLAKAARWRKRFLLKGLAGLEKDAPRPGRTPAIGKEAVAEIVRRTTQDKPLNSTHWSTRSMDAAAGVSDTSILRIWRSHGLKPNRIESFKLSNDPNFSDKLEAIVGMWDSLRVPCTFPENLARFYEPSCSSAKSLDPDILTHFYFKRFSQTNLPKPRGSRQHSAYSTRFPQIS